MLEAILESLGIPADTVGVVVGTRIEFEGVVEISAEVELDVTVLVSGPPFGPEVANSEDKETPGGVVPLASREVCDMEEVCEVS